ncbi:uncharacterized protein LOC128214387 [Mya arenaria]|uniref:uncharacterized protein LOC128214387 n=1 Tax=Mya arenaria TaxID=6604 RepID=UPI0022E5DD73|nr:uncharacterized protein LOC128214387 [Mya arenaria]
MATKEPADTNTSNDSTTAEGECKTELVDKEKEWKSCLDAIKQAISKDKMLALHCEGDNLSRKGKMQFLTIATREKAYVFDIQKLKMLPFENGLREILEDKNVMKLMFDCREDADALFHQFHVKLNGVLDIQLLEIMKRPQFKKHGINRKRGNYTTFDAVDLKSISECMTEYIISDNMTKGRREGVGRKSKWENRHLTVDQMKMIYPKNKVLSIFCLFDLFEPVGEGMKRLNIASRIYVDLKRSIPSREYNDFENNRYLPVDVIPDKGSVSFPVGNISCKTCHRRFPQDEFSNYELKTNNQMCRICKKVKNDNDVYQNRLNRWGEYRGLYNDSTTNDSTTNDSTTDDFTTNDSTTDDFTTNDSTTDDFTTNDSTTDDFTTNDSTTNDSTTNDFTSDDSTTNDSTTEDFTSDDSTTDDSTSNDSTTVNFTTDGSTISDFSTDYSTTDDSTTNDSTTDDFTTNDFTTNDSTTNDSTTDDFTIDDLDDFTTDDFTTDAFTTDDDIDEFDYNDPIDNLTEEFYFYMGALCKK